MFNKDDMQKIGNRKHLLAAIHVIGWGIFFAFPLFFTRNDHQFIVTLRWYLGYFLLPLSCMIVFYTNYFYFIDNILFPKKIFRFIVINLLVIILLGLLLHFWQEFYRTYISPPEPEEVVALRKVLPKPPRFLFLSRDMLLMGLTFSLSIDIKMTSNWYKTEGEKRELEKAKAEAELKNLKSQLNPHFLFNTLNNIYSLIAIDPERAQLAVHDLSRLLRHVLYDNNQNLVSIDREFIFMKSYIELMSLRLPKHTRLEVNIPEEGKGVMIAPLLFITLIENAFKHGISNTQDSFIRIRMELQESQRVSCIVENSYFPKNDEDRSGSGIGIQNLQRRLQLLYPGKYILKIERADDRFMARLIINF